MPNPITMLKADHVKVKGLLRQLEATGSRATKERERLVRDIERELKVHSQIEEELFYPTFKKVSESTESEELFYEATEEHHVVDMVLPALKAANPKSHEFEAKAKVLKDLLEHHIREEETQMFVQARKLMDDEQLRALGDLMQTRKELLLKMWDSPVLRPVKKIQSAVHKMLPTKVKNMKADAIAAMVPDR
ncbi:MAG TPA: hemerythrin domain-containing protein [Thermoanaerobaculia bacterium]|nr:hemerythrin domain-containing protein [Thermoanaerobaculia bacterium]